ncbi:hypothetical protein ACEPPN_005527 [Leptodophora sp. 'Broadleaf-Isolate-01']
MSKSEERYGLTCITCPIRCPTCKRWQSTDEYPTGRKTCKSCLSRLRDVYRQQKGKPVSDKGRKRQFTQAQQVVEKAMRERLRLEKWKVWWLEDRARWLQGGRDFRNGDLATFEKGPVYLNGPYRQWEGYAEPREKPASAYERWDTPKEGWEKWKPTWPRLHEDLRPQEDPQEVNDNPEEDEEAFARGMTPPEQVLEHPDGEGTPKPRPPKRLASPIDEEQRWRSGQALLRAAMEEEARLRLEGDWEDPKTWDPGRYISEEEEGEEGEE